jgi:hypothetical protein
VQAVAGSYVQAGELALPQGTLWPVELQHPRSLSQYSGKLVPGSYVGLPLLYGFLGKLVGIHALLWLTALLAGLGVWLMFIGVRRWWGNSAGLIAGVVLAVCPAYWYAATQPFTPAIPFLVLAGAAVALLTKERLNYWQAFSVGLCAAASLAIRPNEVLWLAPVLIVIAISRKISFATIGLAMLGMVLPIALALHWQQLTFGSVWGSGYNAVVASSGTGLFTFHPRVATRTIWLYMIQLHWWLVALFGVAKIWAWQQRRQNQWWLWYMVCVGIIFLVQIYTYASWVTADSPGIAEPTIGNSQVRYMLPFLASMVPLVGLLLSQWKQWAIYVLLVVWAGWGVRLAMFSAGDGSVYVQRTLTNKAASLQIIQQHTDPATLIVAGKNDKTVVGLRPTTMNPSVAEWEAIAAGLRRGWPAAIYLVNASLPNEALLQGINSSQQYSLPDGAVLMVLDAK